MPRLTSSMQYEAARAMLSMAGIRLLVQSSTSPLTTAEDDYTVTLANTRRVAIVHLGNAAGDIRFAYNAVADANDIPVIPQQYFVVDAEKGDVLSFYNTSAGTIVVYVAELD